MVPLSIRPPPLSHAPAFPPHTQQIQARRKLVRVSTRVPASTDDDDEQQKQTNTIQLQFIGAKKNSADGSYPVQSVSTVSGEKVLRNLMLENKIDLYATYIIDGEDLLSERTSAELRYLKKKPESWRLACQIVVGDKVNSGKVTVQCQPQWKK